MKKTLALVLSLVMLLTAATAMAATEINYWSVFTGGDGAVMQGMVDAFNASQDEVIVNCIYQGDYNAAGAKLQAALSGSGESAPHVAQIEITRVGFYAEEGPVSRYFGRNVLDLEKMKEEAAAMTDEQVDVLVQQTLSAMTRADMEAAVLPAIAAQMGIPADMAAPMLANLTDD